MIYPALDIFFFGFHTLLILFNLFGWIWRKTRMLNFITLSLTAFSWGILGIWYGFGYCPSTHWHWEVRREMGLYDMPNSYIKFLVDQLSGLNVDAGLVDALTLIGFIAALGISTYLNFFRKHR